MSAMPISPMISPTIDPSRRHLRVVPTPVAGLVGSRARLHLTVRGRVVLAVLALALLAAVGAFTSRPATAGSSPSPVRYAYVTVQPGETLWQIAGQVAPQTDRRDTVARLMEINALSTGQVQAGQRLAIPAG